MMINKYNRVFFDSADTSGTTPTPAFTKKKRNLVALSTPLIIKLTPYEKEETVIRPSEDETTTTTTVTYFKTNKSFNQILDAYLMDRTIKFYFEEPHSNNAITGINIVTMTLVNNNIVFQKGIIIENNKTIYHITSGSSEVDFSEFFSTSPDTYMTTEMPVFKYNNEENADKPIDGSGKK